MFQLKIRIRIDATFFFVSSVKKMNLYVSGRSKGGERIMIVLVPNERGWRSRSTLRAYHNNIYVSRETEDEVMDWVCMDVNGARSMKNREAALALLSSEPETMGACPTGYLECDPLLSPCERAEKVVQHLERCC